MPEGWVSGLFSVNFAYSLSSCNLGHSVRKHTFFYIISAGLIDTLNQVGEGEMENPECTRHSSCGQVMAAVQKVPCNY